MDFVYLNILFLEETIVILLFFDGFKIFCSGILRANKDSNRPFIVYRRIYVRVSSFLKVSLVFLYEPFIF